MRIYLAGPLFTEAERRFLDDCAHKLEAAGIECFVPHRQTADVAVLDAATVYAVDTAGLFGADAVVAWLDGPMVDDGTACEIGMFAELCRREPDRHRGIVGFATDWRTRRSRDAGAVADGLNLFVAGAIQTHGSIVWSIDEVIETLLSI